MSDDKSILLRMEEQGQKAPRVSLKGAERSAEATERYEILGEIARGGVGLVHRGRDNDIGRDVGLSGTPAIVFDDGTLISGYLPPDQLKARLDQAATSP